MAELTREQKKEWAHLLYTKEHLTQLEIAEKVGVSRQTVSKWIKDGKWEELRVGLTITREQQIESMYRQVAEMNKTISSRPEGERFASSKEADTLGKLSSAIKKLEIDAGISDIISVGQRFIKFVRSFDLDKAKDITRLFDAFIKDTL